MILYLDFDGVLHDEDVDWRRNKAIRLYRPGCTLFEWEPILVDMLALHPEVQIVLSTQWVRIKSFSYALNCLRPSLRDRVIGATFHSRLTNKRSFDAMPRGLQVATDVSRRGLTEWIAIDDDDFGWPAWCRDKLVLTHGRLGMSAPLVQDAIRGHLKYIQRNRET
jgi:hypothetical protein